MKILVDADACPVKAIIKKLAVKKDIPVVMVCDTSHILTDDYCEIVTVDKHNDSADIYIVNIAKKGDVVITQDYGVATLAIAKGVYAFDNNGMQFCDDNIDRLLFERFLGKKLRNAGARTKGPKKRTGLDDEGFEKSFSCFLEKIC